jgi:hypothetical protein
MANQLSVLPSQLRDPKEEANRFDLMILSV